VAVDVFGDLNVPRGLPRVHGGRRNPGVEFDSALCVRFSANLRSGIGKSAPRRLGLDSLDSSSSLTLFRPSTSPHSFLAGQPLALSAPFKVPFTFRRRPDHQPRPGTKNETRLTKLQRPPLQFRLSQFEFLHFRRKTDSPRVVRTVIG
jgi:hypothetical protein